MRGSICDPNDISIKSFFLGPQAENGDWLREKWIQIVDQWLAWRRQQFPGDGNAISQLDQSSLPFIQSLRRIDHAVDRVLGELQNETIKFSPRFLGHMVSEASMPGLLGHICALLHNPNNTSKEVSRVTSIFEEEAIAELAAMVGLPAHARGHFTSGGTLANFEALWRARFRLDTKLSLELCMQDCGDAKDLEKYSLLKLGPWKFAAEYQKITGRAFAGPVTFVPQNRHFSWIKAVSIMGLGEDSFVAVALDSDGRLNVADLRQKIATARSDHRPVLMVVSVAGTTEMGEVDPIDDVNEVIVEARQEGEDIWHHVDAAYGGYYSCMLDGGELETQIQPNVVRALRALANADSITLDPHKLGYVPYSCGAFIARDPSHYQTRTFAANYLHQDNQSAWSSTIEGSRSGTGVTATWLSNVALGLNADGYGRVLAKGIQARRRMADHLAGEVSDLYLLEPSDLNIILFCIAKPGTRLSQLNARSRQIFEQFELSPTFSISKTILSRESYHGFFERLHASRGIKLDVDEMYVLRLVFMNPFIDSRESSVDYVQAFVAELKRC